MRGLNQVTIVGNLGSDPEIKTFDNGNTVLNFSVATNEAKKEGDTWVDHTEWHRISLWGKSAEAVGKFLRKGHMVYVTGKLRTRTVGDGDDKRYYTGIIADQVQILDKKSDGNSTSKKQDEIWSDDV